MIILVIFILAIPVYIIYKMSTSGGAKMTDDYFEQAGVRVDFKQRKLTIKGRTYDVSQFRSYRIESTTSRNNKFIIKLDDFKKPTHSIRIMSFSSNGIHDFEQRFIQAMEKAGISFK